MTSLAVFVGIDYHQEKVQLCLLDGERRVLMNRPCENHWRNISLLAGSRGRPVRVAIEACCGAADLADELAERLGWSVRLAHPGYVANLKRSPDKTDFGDARMLADLTRIGYLPQVWLAPSELRELRRLVRYRQQLVNERRNKKLRIRALLRDCRAKAPSHFNAWTKPWLAWLETTDQLSGHTKWIMQRHLQQLIEQTKQIREVEQLLSKVAADDALVGKLMTYNGIGLITAVMLRAEIGRFDRFATGKQLSRFIGLSPRNVSSGKRMADAGLIKAGNKLLRATVIEAAHRLIHYDPRWEALSARLLKKGKPRNVVVAAVANRWIRWLFHQMQPDQLAA